MAGKRFADANFSRVRERRTRAAGARVLYLDHHSCYFGLQRAHICRPTPDPRAAYLLPLRHHALIARYIRGGLGMMNDTKN